MHATKRNFLYIFRDIMLLRLRVTLYIDVFAVEGHISRYYLKYVLRITVYLTSKLEITWTYVYKTIHHI